MAAIALLVVAPLFLGVVLALHYRGGVIFVRRPRRDEEGRSFALLGFPITPEMRRSVGWRVLADLGVAALPQLWNVLRGELSIVGPRPRPLGQAPPPVRPGLTGPAQLAAMAGPVDDAELMRLDADYAREWSLAGDLAIVVRTMAAAVR